MSTPWSAVDEHRRVMRVTLLQPIAGAAGTEHIYVVDASLSGVRLSHLTLFQQRDDCRIEFQWDGRPIQFAGQVRWTKLQRIGSAAFAKSVYQSGLEIAAITPQAHEALRGLIESHIERAFDEQKANARGIPPQADQSGQSGQASQFARHELVRGVWRKVVTSDPGQPPSGFSVDASLSRSEVEMLRAAYESADPAMRDIIRKFAELSISSPDGIPTRRYTP
jgi:hypothetical protein